MNVIDDLSTITSMPRANLTKMSERIEWLICNAAYEASFAENKTAEVNLGFGKLFIRLDDDQLRYRFQPSRKLEKSIIDAYENGLDPIEQQCGNAVKEIFVKTYKDLL